MIWWSMAALKPGTIFSGSCKMMSLMTYGKKSIYFLEKEANCFSVLNIEPWNGMGRESMPFCDSPLCFTYLMWLYALLMWKKGIE